MIYLIRLIRPWRKRNKRKSMIISEFHNVNSTTFKLAIKEFKIKFKMKKSKDSFKTIKRRDQMIIKPLKWAYNSLINQLV